MKYKEVDRKDLKIGDFYYLDKDNISCRFLGELEGDLLFYLNEIKLLRSDKAYLIVHPNVRMKKIPLSKLITGKKYFLSLSSQRTKLSSSVPANRLSKGNLKTYRGKIGKKYYADDKYNENELLLIESAWEVK